MSPQLGLAGDATIQSCPVSFAGTSVTAVFEIETREHERRLTAGIGPTVDRDLLEALAVLPYLEHVQWATIDPMKRAVLDTAPRGVVSATGSSVIRLWRPPLRLQAVTRTVRQWRRDLQAISLFAPDAPRYLILDRSVSAQHPIVSDANWLGVGLMLENGDVLLPAEKLVVAPTPRHWRLLESIYEAWLRAAGTHTATTG